MASTEGRADLGHGSLKLSNSDERVFAQLRDAHRLYDDYLRIADLTNVSKLAGKELEPVPPRTDLPLTLAGAMPCQLGAR